MIEIKKSGKFANAPGAVADISLYHAIRSKKKLVPAMTYLAVRHLHIACAILSISLFALRGGLSLAAVDWRRWQALRWLPHLNDTVLLCAAAWLAYTSGQYPGQQAWLTAKVIALVCYILLGKQALKPDLPRASRAWWYAAALLSAAYIVSVAHARNPLPF